MSFILKKSVVLVGLMGAGKSAIGHRLAERLGVPFYDSDSEIEKQEGMTVSDIFLQQGEGWFREMERQTIARLLEGKPAVIATGGGAFVDEKVRALVQQKALSIWLKADIDVLLERVSRKETRPLLAQGNKQGILNRLMKERYPVYAEAHYVVNSDNGPHEDKVNQIIRIIKA